MFVRDGGYKEGRYPEEDECQSMRQSYKRGNLMDDIESLDNRAVQPNDEGTFVLSAGSPGKMPHIACNACRTA